MTQKPGNNLLQWLHAPLDVASLVYFRIVFGAILLWDLLLYDQKRIAYHWLAPKFHFTYFGFEWIHPLPGEGMFLLVYVLRVLAVMIAAGFLYRASCTLFFLGFTYIFLIDQAEHLNHIYLTCLLSFLMIFIPAHRAFSVDARLRPGLRSDAAPAWCLYLLRFQVAVVYIFGALAKVNGDWLRGEPVRSWLAGRADYPVVGPLFGYEATVYFIAYGGLFFDLLVVPLLLSRRTRVPALAVSLFFHLMNNWLFDIAIFPWLMLAATFLYFPPEWPRIFLGFAPVDLSRTSFPVRKLTAALLGAYAAVQVLVPLRHWLYPGDVNWTEEGHRFAWHMKLRSKAGQARFTATDPATGRTWPVQATDYLSPWQSSRMATRPDMILQFSHYLADTIREQEGLTNIEIRARVLVTMNGRRPQLLVNPEVDLASEPRSLAPARWIQPLTETLPPHAVLVQRAAARRARGKETGDIAPMAAPQEPVILERMIAEQRTRIEEIDRALAKEFNIDPRGFYQFDADNLVICALTPRPDAGAGAAPRTARDVEKKFVVREHSRLADKAKGDRFLLLQAEKTKANSIINVLEKEAGGGESSPDQEAPTASPDPAD